MDQEQMVVETKTILVRELMDSPCPKKVYATADEDIEDRILIIFND